MFYTMTLTVTSVLPSGFASVDIPSEVGGLFSNPLIISLLGFIVALMVVQGFIGMLKASVK